MKGMYGNFSDTTYLNEVNVFIGVTELIPKNSMHYFIQTGCHRKAFKTFHLSGANRSNICEIFFFIYSLVL